MTEAEAMEVGGGAAAAAAELPSAEAGPSIHSAPSEDVAPTERRSKRRTKRWGEETEAGKKVLEEVSSVGAAEVLPGPPPLLPGPPPLPEGAAAAPGAEPAPKRARKTRWEEAPAVKTLPALPGFGSMIVLPAAIAALVDINPETLELQRQLNQINNKLQQLNSGFWVDDTPIEQRSPSPEPTYNESGLRSNTREQRVKDKLQRERMTIIGELIKKNPNYKPPSDYRPEKKFRKLPIPQDQYPGYNFIGLIIGPRGNTQKRMEKESGCKIAIRGRGSVKEGRARKDGVRDPTDDEETHVLVTGDTEEAVEKGAAMVQKLLVPTDDSANDHKRRQLMELASLNGTLRDHEYLALQRAAEDKGEPFVLPDHIKARVEEQYRRDVVAVHGEEAGKIENEYKNFLQELGGDIPRPELDDGPGGSGRFGRPGLGSRLDDDDPRALYVGYLPLNMLEEELGQLLETCGRVDDVRIVHDKFTGQSRGFGFARMSNEAGAALAIQRLHNYQVGGKRLVVRPKGRNTLPPPPPLNADSHGHVMLPGPPLLAPGALHAAAAPRPEFDEPAAPGLEDDWGAAAGAHGPGMDPYTHHHHHLGATAGSISPYGQHALDGQADAAAQQQALPPPPPLPAHMQHLAAGAGVERSHDDGRGGAAAGTPEPEGDARESEAQRHNIEAEPICWVAPPPAEEPGPPGDEEYYFALRSQEAAEAAAAWSLYQQSQYAQYGDATGYDMSQYMGTEYDAAAYGAAGHTGAGTWQAAAKEVKKEPKVVQVLTLDKEELARAKKKKEEEEKQKQKEKEERLKEMAAKRRAEALGTSARAAPDGSPAPPPPPPPPAGEAAQGSGAAPPLPSQRGAPPLPGRGAAAANGGPHAAARRGRASPSHSPPPRPLRSPAGSPPMRPGFAGRGPPPGARRGSPSPPPYARRSPSPRRKAPARRSSPLPPLRGPPRGGSFSPPPAGRRSRSPLPAGAARRGAGALPPTGGRYAYNSRSPPPRGAGGRPAGRGGAMVGRGGRYGSRSPSPYRQASPPSSGRGGHAGPARGAAPAAAPAAKAAPVAKAENEEPSEEGEIEEGEVDVAAVGGHGEQGGNAAGPSGRRPELERRGSYGREDFGRAGSRGGGPYDRDGKRGGDGRDRERYDDRGRGGWDGRGRGGGGGARGRDRGPAGGAWRGPERGRRGSYGDGYGMDGGYYEGEYEEGYEGMEAGYGYPGGTGPFLVAVDDGYGGTMMMMAAFDGSTGYE